MEISTTSDVKRGRPNPRLAAKILTSRPVWSRDLNISPVHSHHERRMRARACTVCAHSQARQTILLPFSSVPAVIRVSFLIRRICSARASFSQSAPNPPSLTPSFSLGVASFKQSLLSLAVATATHQTGGVKARRRRREPASWRQGGPRGAVMALTQSSSVSLVCRVAACTQPGCRRGAGVDATRRRRPVGWPAAVQAS